MRPEQTRASEFGVSWRAFVGLGMLFAAAVLCGLWWRESIHEASAIVIGALGLQGLLGVVVLIDTFPTPFSYMPLIVFALNANEPLWQVLCICYGGSLCGSLLGYLIGRWMGVPKRLESWMKRRHPRALELLERSSVFGVALVGFLPLPMALGTWTAGAMHSHPLGVAIACHARMIKTALLVALILGGLGVAEPVPS